MLESFLAVLRGERPDRVVWTGDLAYWIAGRKQQSEARPEWDTEEGYLRLHAELGLMPYVYYEKFWAAEPRYDASVDIGVQVRGGTATRTFCTPVGELREENFYSPTSCSTAITRYAVQSKRDLEVLLYLVEHRHLEPMHMGDYRQRETVEELRRAAVHRIAAFPTFGAVLRMGGRAERGLPDCRPRGLGAGGFRADGGPGRSDPGGDRRVGTAASPLP